MTGAPDDLDLLAANDPATPPQQLADIAARRYDLHPLIAVHPQAYPQLRTWMTQVNPVGAQPPYVTMPAGAPAPAAPRRRGGIGYWLGGCGCLAIIVVIILVVVVGGLLGSREPSTSSPVDRAPSTTAAEDQVVAEQLAIYADEKAKYDTLAAQLEGNPVAPLVTQQDFMDRIAHEAAVPNISEIAARSVAKRTADFRKELEAQVTAAQARRENTSGTLTEQLIDQAGDGFIDVRWDAASACGDSDDGSITTGCVRAGSPLVVHLQAESQAGSDWERKMVAAHELAHVYQHADARRFEDGKGEADRLVAKGLFQGSTEKMADCYALTYYDQDSLKHGNVTLGYGYVCNASERQAIRTWAADVNAPMPG
ncbi:MAG: hypothetical protein WBA87_09875 [Microbacterium sp.]